MAPLSAVPSSGGSIAPQPAPENAPVHASIHSSVNGDPPPGETAATATFIIIAFLTLLGVAMVRQAERTPVSLPGVSMGAEEPLDVPVLIPTPDDENAPSGLRPVPAPQESTGSVRK
ncbi:MAG: hypothetical protein ABWZ40_12980 [Caulobacterales bacterium]